MKFAYEVMRGQNFIIQKRLIQDYKGFTTTYRVHKNISSPMLYIARNKKIINFVCFANLVVNISPRNNVVLSKKDICSANNYQIRKTVFYLNIFFRIGLLKISFIFQLWARNISFSEPQRNISSFIRLKTVAKF